MSDAAIGIESLAAQRGQNQTAPLCGMQQVLAARMQGWMTADQKPLSAHAQALTACG